MKQKLFWFLSFTPVLIFLLVASVTGSRMPFTDLDRFKTPPVPMIERFAFGFQEPMADMLWVQAIQGFDYCEKEISERVCAGKSWLYQMLEAITNLAPYFRMPYATGPLALTVIISDYEGASLIFDKAVKAFPKDWPILYRAAYHALYEEKDNIKAAGLLTQAAKYGAPPWLYSLATRLYTQEGQFELAQRLYQDLEKSDMDPDVLKRMRERLLEKRAK